MKYQPYGLTRVDSSISPQSGPMCWRAICLACSKVIMLYPGSSFIVTGNQLGFALLASRTDTTSDVIHDAAQRPHGRQRSSIVDNSAADAKANVNKLSPGRLSVRHKASTSKLAQPAPGRASVRVRSQPRSVPHQPERLFLRSPGCDPTPVQTSKRTSSQGPPPDKAGKRPRGPGIRSTCNGLLTGGASAAKLPAGARAMSEPDTAGTVAGFGGFTHFGGLDWARYQHQLVVVDPTGRIVLSLAFANDADGWAQFRQKVTAFGRLAIAVETNCGPAVERLLEAAVAVYPMNPKAATRYRDRKAPAGAKDDELDAWSFADALRTDGHGWRELAAQDPLTAELRLLCRDEVKLISQRTALVNQLQAA